MTPPAHPGTFERLVAEGAAVPTEGWDFSWFEGRATEARPSWGYARSMAGRLAGATAVLDVQTGGGEVLDFALEAMRPPPGPARRRHRGLGAQRRPGHPAAASARSPGGRLGRRRAPALRGRRLRHGRVRHPVEPHWDEVARVLMPGGTYFAQHVGPASVFELIEYFLGPLPEDSQPAP